jgi:chemotaxis signal transduction protein
MTMNDTLVKGIAVSEERWLLIEVNRQAFAISCANVIELLEQTSRMVSKLPGCEPPWAGVFKHRESVLPVLDARVMLGFPSFEEEIEDLRSMLKAREEDHVNWLTELKSCCTTGREFTKATDPHKCAFGKWYDQLRGSRTRMNRLTGDDPSLTMMVEGFDGPHKAIHGIAQKALELAGDGQIEAAEALIAETWEGELGRMRQLFTSLLEGIIARRKSRFVVMEISGDRVAMVVDTVKSLVQVDESEIKPIEAGEKGEACLKGVYLFEDQGPVMILDVDAIGRLVARDEPLAQAPQNQAA